MVRPRVWSWTIEWDDHKCTFTGFTAARSWLLEELMWLAEDLDDDLTWDAWLKVSKWEHIDGQKYYVTAGNPPSRYTMRPRRFDEE